MTAHFVHLLDAIQRRATRMACLVEDMVQEATEATIAGDQTLARRVITRDADVDAEEVDVESEVIRLMALYQPVGSDLRLLCTILKTNNDLERIADCAVNIAERARHLDRATVDLHRETLIDMSSFVRGMLRKAVAAFATEDLDAAHATFSREQQVDELYGQIIRQLVADAAATSDVMAARLDVLSVAKNLERIADHATNIAEDVIFLSTGRIVRHSNDVTRPDESDGGPPTSPPSSEPDGP